MAPDAFQSQPHSKCTENEGAGQMLRIYQTEQVTPESPIDSGGRVSKTFI